MPEKTDHDFIIEIHTVLLGTDGHKGIAEQVCRNTKAIVKIWIILAVLVSSMGGGAYGIFQVLLQR